MNDRRLISAERVMNPISSAGPRLRLWQRPQSLLLITGLLLIGTSAVHSQTLAQRAALARIRSGSSQAVPANGAEATAISLDSPNGLVFDSAGNLYIADTDDDIILEVSVAGQVSTIAGNGVEGFAGDGGSATSAQLDTPEGVAVDANGNIYIADTHNNRIREVSGGTIATIAGTGVPGFSGDGGVAASAMLDMPVAVCVDAQGNIYIADTNNDRIREITGGVINTVAGNGLQSYSGDGGPATSAALDSPTGVAVDSALNIYIGDTHNQRVRMVTATSGSITTIAGTGIKGFTADGSSLSAALASPSGLWVDASGTVYVADADNNRIRTISGGTVVTIAGNGAQGFSGDSGAATGATLNTPRAVTTIGNSTFFSDTLNNRVRELNAGTINTTGGQPGSTSESLLIGGSPSAVYGTGSLAATFSNNGQVGTGMVTFYDGTGPGPALIGSVALSSNAASINTGMLAAGTHYIVASYAGDSKNPPIVSGVYVFTVTQAQLTAVANSVSLLYGQAIPTLTGTLSGVLPQDSGNVSAVFTTTAALNSDPGTYPISVSLTGSAAGNYTVTLGSGSGSVTISKAPTTTTLMANSSTPVLGTGAILTATVASTTSGTPAGTVIFYNGATQLNTTPAALSNGVATLTVTTLPVGAFSLTAVYSGSQDFIASTSSALAGTVLSPDFGIAATPATQAVLPTRSVNYTLTVTPVNSTFVYPVTLSASGLPNGVTATFTPSATVATGAGTATVLLTLSAGNSALLQRRSQPFNSSGPFTALALLFIPFAFNRRFRRRCRRLSGALPLAVLLLVLSAVAGLSGCGGGGFFGHSTETYTVTVTATGGPDTHSTTVTLTVQ